MLRNNISKKDSNIKTVAFNVIRILGHIQIKTTSLEQIKCDNKKTHPPLASLECSFLFAKNINMHDLQTTVAHIKTFQCL